MQRFDNGALFSERLLAGALSDEEVNDFSNLLGDFHNGAPKCRIGEHANAHLARMMAALDGATPALDFSAADVLRRWIANRCADLEPFWTQRHSDGFVRECHGDLHLANIVRLESGVAAFDCIEFDSALRCIDVMEDAAFPLMDFVARGRPDLGWYFLNGWLERTGDYAGRSLRTHRPGLERPPWCEADDHTRSSRLGQEFPIAAACSARRDSHSFGRGAKAFARARTTGQLDGERHRPVYARSDSGHL